MTASLKVTAGLNVSARLKVAVVGSGVSGLTAAHLLHPHHDVTVLEADTRIGGHANTVSVRVGSKTVDVDTGFLVYNERNYPGEGRLVVDEDGTRHVFGPAGAPAVTVTVHDPRFWGEVLRRGTVGLGEAYASGWFDVDSMAELIRLAAAEMAPITARRDRLADALAPLRDRLPTRSRGKGADRAFVAAHYDLSNEFFSLLLDPTMAYSCARFEEPGTTLERAQQAKLDRLCDALELGPDDHLLEIGTGWGGLAVHAAQRHGCRVTTTTVSAEQHAHASATVAALGLDDRIQLLDRDYRELCGTYDKVVSVEMIEAVDWRDHGAYFDVLAERVRPGGLAALQAIVIDDRSYERAKRHTDFIKAFVFPGGCLPSVASIERSAAGTGRLAVADVTRIGHHYPETLRRWQANLHAHRAEIEALGFDQRRFRIWDMYFEYCIGAFESGHIDVVQVLLQKAGSHGQVHHHDQLVAVA